MSKRFAPHTFALANAPFSFIYILGSVMYQLMNRLLCYQVGGKTVWKTNTINFAAFYRSKKPLGKRCCKKV